MMKVCKIGGGVEKINRSHFLKKKKKERKIIIEGSK